MYICSTVSSCRHASSNSCILPKPYWIRRSVDVHGLLAKIESFDWDGFYNFDQPRSDLVFHSLAYSRIYVYKLKSEGKLR